MSDNEKSTQTEEPNFRYNAALAQDIENKWQKIWDEQGTFWAANVNGDLKDGKGRNAEGRTAYFAMDMFPYPSGKGLHVGHPLGYLASDVVSRYHRMKGENVLHAMGYDAFGLPAEQYAVQTGQHPRVTTEANIANMSRQLHRMGLSFDNRRTFATIDPGYVRWTQWIFSRIYDSWYDEDATNPSGSRGSARPIAELVAKFESGEKAIPGHESDGKQWSDLTDAEQQDILNDFRLAYISKSPVNWCPGLGTVRRSSSCSATGSVNPMVPPCTSPWPLPTVTRTWKSTPPVPTRCSAPRSPWFPRNITCWRTCPPNGRPMYPKTGRAAMPTRSRR